MDAKHSVSSWARDPVRNPPPGSVPFAKFSTQGFTPRAANDRAAVRVGSLWTAVSHAARAAIDRIEAARRAPAR